MKKKSPVTKKRVPRKRTKAKEGIYLGLKYDSEGELYFLKWVEELIKEGYIKSIKRAESYILTEGCINIYTQKLKKSSKLVSQTLLKPSLYTPEFEIEWSSKYEKFVWIYGDNSKCEKSLIGHIIDKKVITIIECKPDREMNNMTRLFINNQKFVWFRYGVFVNLVKPAKFFDSCFTPKDYLLTPTGRQRLLKYIPKSLNEFLTEI